MRIPAAILMATIIATPAMAIDIVSGSGSVIKNGAGLTVINGDFCSGRMQAACLDRDNSRAQGSIANPVAPAAAPPTEPSKPTEVVCVTQAYECD